MSGKQAADLDDSICPVKAEFLVKLAETSNVSESAKAVQISTSTVYQWRKDDPVFNTEWGRALAIGYEALELEMLRRARFGTRKNLYYQGEKIDSFEEYSDVTALKLLAAHKDNVAMTRSQQNEGQDREAIKAELDRKLSEMRRRLLAKAPQETKSRPIEKTPEKSGDDEPRQKRTVPKKTKRRSRSGAVENS